MVRALRWLPCVVPLCLAACLREPPEQGAGGGGVACDVPSRCPGQDDDCARRTCIDGICGMEALDAEVTSQMAGDCRRRICQDGARVEIDDPDDPPDDGNACTRDACDAGHPVHTPLMAGTACGAGASTHCDGAGRCVGCQTDADCPADDDCADWSCSAEVCSMQPASAGTPCGPPAGCHDGHATPMDQCDGRGACTDSGQTSCAPYLCNASGTACSDVCFVDAECCCGLVCYVPGLQGYGECIPPP